MISFWISYIIKKWSLQYHIMFIQISYTSLKNTPLSKTILSDLSLKPDLLFSPSNPNLPFHYVDKVVVVRWGGGLPSAPPRSERQRRRLSVRFSFFSDLDSGSVELEVSFSEVWFRGSGAPVVVMVVFVVVYRCVGGGVFLRRRHLPEVLSWVAALEVAFCSRGWLCGSLSPLVMFAECCWCVGFPCVGFVPWVVASCRICFMGFMIFFLYLFSLLFFLFSLWLWCLEFEVMRWRWMVWW
jgi:hypothetical protein